MLIEEDTAGISKTVALKNNDRNRQFVITPERYTFEKNDNCELKRIFFQPLSMLTYQFLKDIHATHIASYPLYCPMAFNDEGAWWLSNTPEVKNPYFVKNASLRGSGRYH